MIVGRGGHRGKTSGRGGKGQTARAGNKRRPELRDFIKRIPKLRGRGVNQNKSFAGRNFVINIEQIEKAFEKGADVNPASLLKARLVSLESGRLPKIKILGTGDITKAVSISGCLISASVKEKVEKAGGKVSPLLAEVLPAPVAKLKPKVKVPVAAK